VGRAHGPRRARSWRARAGRLGRTDGQRGQGWWLRASERTWTVGLRGRPMDTVSEKLVLAGGRSTSSCCSKISTFCSPLLRTRWEEVSWRNGSAAWKVVLLRPRAFEAQEQGIERISDGVWGGSRVGLARRAARTCSLRPGGQLEQLAQPTDVMAAQAGQLVHLDDISPPPASKMRKRLSWEAGEARLASSSHRWPTQSKLAR
jgi:hypothetical protein